MAQVIAARPGPDRGPRRVPPHNLIAERSLLGAMLLSGDAIADAAEIVEGHHFYKPAHGHVFDAIIRLYNAGEAVDAVTVADELRRAGTLEMAGGEETLLELAAGTPGTSNAAHYARIVEEHASLRKLIAIANEIADQAYEMPDDVSAMIDEAEGKVFGLSDRRVADTTKILTELLDETLNRLEELYDRGEGITGVPTGFVDLDDLLSGLQPSALVVLGARPAMGKSALALGMATHVAVHERLPVLFFSLEMSHLELSQRILCAEARVDSKRMRNGQLQESDWPRITNAVTRLAEAPLYIDDNPNLTVMEIRAKARRLKAKLGRLGLVVVDYLQLMTGRSNAESRQVEVSEISRGLKILARELECPVLALSQLSRRVDERTDKTPLLSDLRESGSIEQDADVVMFIYRDEVYHRDTQEQGMAQVIVAKHRNGPTGKVDLVFLGHFTRFGDLART